MDNEHILEARGRVTILLDLLESGESNTSSLIIPGYRGQSAVYSAKYEYKNANIVEEIKGDNNAKILKLTNKGKRIAQHLLEIEKILKEK